jgi:hypothetical protein
MAAEEAIREDALRNIAHAYVAAEMEQCADVQLAALRDAIVKGDTAAAAGLLRKPPLTEINPWYMDSWKSAQTPEITERIGSAKTEVYAAFFGSGVTVAANRMDDYFNTRTKLDVLLMPGAPRTPEIVYTQLQQVAEMAGALHDMVLVGQYFSKDAKVRLGISLSEAERARLADGPAVKGCKAVAKALAGDAATARIED